MKMNVTVLGVNHYDMTSEGGQKGASLRLFGDAESTNNYFGHKTPQAEFPFEEVSKLKSVRFPAEFKADVEIGTVKKKGSGNEVPVLRLRNLEYVHTLEFCQVKG